MPVIKPAKHKMGKPSGMYRALMTDTGLERLGYGRRWLIPRYNSASKRTTGSTLNAKTDHGRMIDTATKVLAYAIRRSSSLPAVCDRGHEPDDAFRRR